MWKLVFFLVVGVVLLTGCESETSSLMMISGGGGGSVVNNFTNNITNNITNNVTTNITNNITNDVMLDNTSFACSDANSYVYNYSLINGVASGLCATDTDTDTNDTGLYYTKSEFNAQNDSYYGFFYDIFSANDALTALGNRITSLNNTKQNSFANSSGQCSGTDKVKNVTSINGVLTIVCDTDSTGVGGGGIGSIASFNNLLNVYNGSLTNLSVNVTTLNNSHQHSIKNVTGSISTQCSSASDRLYNITLTDGTITSLCGTDATGSGGGATQLVNDTQNLTASGYNLMTTGHLYQHGVPVYDFNAWFCDFTLTTYAVTACAPFYTGVVTGTGGISAAVATSLNKTVGLYSISKGTVANSGYRWVMSPAMFLLQGKEAFTTKLSIVQPVSANNTLGIFGFCDATTITTMCVDGVYFNFTGNSTSGKVRGYTTVNSAILTTATNYNITYGVTTFYIYKLYSVNHTLVNFSIYDDNKVLVWSDTISSASAMPITAGRETGAGVWLGTSGAGAAAAIISNIDYMLTEVEQPTRWIP